MMKKGLTAYQIKIIAIIAMFFDHFAYIVINMPVDNNLKTVMALFMNCIGRITMPIMCYFIAEGYYHTSNLKRYFLRLFVFAVIAQLPFYLFEINSLPDSLKSFISGNVYHMNVIYTLFMGLCALTVLNAKNINGIVKFAGMAAAVFLTRHSDWRLYGVMWILVFGAFRGNFKKQAIGFAVLTFIRCIMNFRNNMFTFCLQMCTLLAIPILYFYNGERGRKSKYGFYIFYPLHLLILGIIKLIMVS